MQVNYQVISLLKDISFIVENLEMEIIIDCTFLYSSKANNVKLIELIKLFKFACKRNNYRLINYVLILFQNISSTLHNILVPKSIRMFL